MTEQGAPSNEADGIRYLLHAYTEVPLQGVTFPVKLYATSPDSFFHAQPGHRVAGFHDDSFGPTGYHGHPGAMGVFPSGLGSMMVGREELLYQLRDFRAEWAQSGERRERGREAR